MEKKQRIRRASAEQIEAMRARGESRSDWQAAEAMAPADVERLADEEDGGLPAGWENTVDVGLPEPRQAIQISAGPKCCAGSRRMVLAIRRGSTRFCAPRCRHGSARNRLGRQDVDSPTPRSHNPVHPGNVLSRTRLTRGAPPLREGSRSGVLAVGECRVEALSDKLSGVFDRLRGRGALSEADVTEALREVRLALLDADVALPVVRDFVAKVRERAIGAEVLSPSRLASRSSRSSMT